MEAPTEIAQDLVLIGQTRDELAFSQPIDITPVLNDKILAVPQNKQTQVEITVTYEYLNRTRTVRKSEMVTIYSPGTLPLGDSVAPIAAMIDPDDPAVHRFARAVVAGYADRADRWIISENISTALLLFEALNTYGIRYVPDPYNPYSKISGKKGAIDSVQYPRAVLDAKNKTGDCDDGSALYAALLENVGIHTTLVDVPGHVYVMFDTGVHSNSFEKMCLPEERYIVKDETIWLPVEVTLYGEPFNRAWEEGLSEYQKWRAQNRLKLVDVRQAWREGYQRTRPLTSPPDIIAPKLGEIEKRIQEMKRQIAQLQNDFLLAVEQDVEAAPDAVAQRNHLGIIYAWRNAYERAKEQFDEIIAREPDNAPAHNNLANLYIMAGGTDAVDAAISSYEKARALSPADGGIYLNLGLGYLMADNPTASQEMLNQSFQHLKNYQAACRLVGVPSQEPAERG